MCVIIIFSIPRNNIEKQNHSRKVDKNKELNNAVTGETERLKRII